MNRLIERTLWSALALAFVATGAGVTPAVAQQVGAGDRITIMVPELAPQAGADDDFGKDVAEELRDLISELHTHQTVSEDDLKDARKEYDLDTEDLYNCISARQLAMRMNWGLVLCGEYEEMGDRQVEVDAKFVGAEDGAEFAVPVFTASERDAEQAARTILQTFDKWQTQLRHVVFCQQYMDSQDWESALRNCNQALEINPSSVQALYKKAYILRETDRHDEALEALDELLEMDPIHQDALKLAGITATEAGMAQRGLTYFNRYMELNPGDVGVRLTLATDMSQAGNPAAALEFAEQGLEVAPNDTTLLTYIGHFASQAASKAEATLNAQQQGSAEPGEAVDPAQVTGFYQTAAEAYQKVYAAMGEETEPQILERMIVSMFKLGNMDEAVALGESAVELDPDNPALWDAYSRALQESGQIEEALAALEKAADLGKATPAMTQRRAMMELDRGNESAAVAALQDAVSSGEMDASGAFNIIFAKAYRDNFQKGRLDPAYQLLEAAGPLAQAEKDRLTRNFWRGYILFEKAKAAHEPMTAASAQKAKPLFERALELFRASRGYEQYHQSANVPQFIDQAQRFIEIEEALIKRGR